MAVRARIGDPFGGAGGVGSGAHAAIETTSAVRMMTFPTGIAGKLVERDRRRGLRLDALLCDLDEQHNHGHEALRCDQAAEREVRERQRMIERRAAARIHAVADGLALPVREPAVEERGAAGAEAGVEQASKRSALPRALKRASNPASPDLNAGLPAARSGSALAARGSPTAQRRAADLVDVAAQHDVESAITLPSMRSIRTRTGIPSLVDHERRREVAVAAGGERVQLRERPSSAPLTAAMYAAHTPSEIGGESLAARRAAGSSGPPSSWLTMRVASAISATPSSGNR